MDVTEAALLSCLWGLCHALHVLLKPVIRGNLWPVLLLVGNASHGCRTLTLAMAAGIGFFLAHIGYQAGEGIGLVVADPATLVTLGKALSRPLYCLSV